MIVNSELNSILSDFSKKSGKPMSQVKMMWEKSIKISEDFYGISEKEFGDEEYDYVKEILKNLLNIKENLVFNFIKSKLTLKEFIENVFGDPDATRIKKDDIKDIYNKLKLVKIQTAGGEPIKGTKPNFNELSKDGDAFDDGTYEFNIKDKWYLFKESVKEDTSGIAMSSVNADKSLGTNQITIKSKDKKVNDDEIIDNGNLIDNK